MSTISWLNSKLGIDALQCIAFVFASLIAWFPGHWVVRAIFHSFTGVAIKQDPDITPRSREDQRNAFKEEFDLNLAALIGRFERVLYVLFMMTGIPTVISGWLVLKAFFAWIETPRVNGNENEEINASASQERMKRFHVYIFGNGLSLIVGIFCGLLGRVFAAAFRLLLA